MGKRVVVTPYLAAMSLISWLAGHSDKSISNIHRRTFRTRLVSLKTWSPSTTGYMQAATSLVLFPSRISTVHNLQTPLGDTASWKHNVGISIP
jgi:hypothetical protein